MKYKKQFITYCNKHGYIEFIEKNKYIQLFIRECQKYKKYLYPEKQIMETLEFIKNETVLLEINKETFIQDKNIQLPYDFDFIIYSSPSLYNNNNIINKLIFYSLPTENLLHQYQISSASILLSEFIIKDKKIKLDLKNNTYNYLIVENVFKRNFLLYFLKKYYLYNEHTDNEHTDNEHNKSYTEEDYANFRLNIIDDNVNTISITSNNTIHVEKDKIIIT
jgi:hypothetical protein